ncbi:MMPL family transporter [Pseudomonas sp. WS 5414]|uniref:efflux RND transporter permease subunit n=1 Tax=Pseudomonas TaxID=286 RepID=UPI0014754B34|nr:MMPL family transporter [Pseudomonas sp. WS 5414]NMY72411.1 MMPL family transporter [Pseudomonas sp. WS 5414]
MATSTFERVLKRYRFWLFALVLALVAGLSWGMTSIRFAADYRAFFPEGEKTVEQLDALHRQFGKSDTLLFVIKNPKGTVFTREYLEQLHELTQQAWHIPHAYRVDSVTNFQHVFAEGDTVHVEALVREPTDLTPSHIELMERLGRNDIELVKRLVSSDGQTLGVLVTLQFPPQTLDAALAATAEGQRLLDDFARKNPQLQVHLTGLAAVEAAYPAAAQQDMAVLTPLMYLIILLVSVLMLRSLGALLVVLIAISMATAATLGASGWLGFEATALTGLLPTIVLATSVAEIMHVLSAARQMSAEYGQRRVDLACAAIKDTIKPIAIGTATNAVGFYSLVFAASPPYKEFGVLAAIGAVMALLVTISVAAVLIPLLRLKPLEGAASRRYSLYMEPLLRYPKLWLLGFVVLFVLAIEPARNNLINDRIVENFDTSIPVRNATEFAMDNLSGIYRLEYVATSARGDISDPGFLVELDRFAQWLRIQPEVDSVTTLGDALKKLNQTMNGGQAAEYRLPSDPALAAQMLLVYEMSLPFGLDLGSQINIDKSATRLVVTLSRLDTQQIRDIKQRADDWWQTHADRAALVPSLGTGEAVVFANLTHISIEYMVNGLLFELVTITLMVALFLRNAGLGLISILPNVFPFFIMFGLWGLWRGEINTAAINVCVVVYGLIVEATIHIMSHYKELRLVQGHPPREALRLTYQHVLPSVFANAVILASGFMVMTLSPFSMNADFGLLAVIAIFLGLIFDALCLPLVLLTFDRFLWGRAATRLATREA